MMWSLLYFNIDIKLFIFYIMLISEALAVYIFIIYVIHITWTLKWKIKKEIRIYTEWVNGIQKIVKWLFIIENNCVQIEMHEYQRLIDTYFNIQLVIQFRIINLTSFSMEFKSIELLSFFSYKKKQKQKSILTSKFSISHNYFKFYWFFFYAAMRIQKYWIANRSRDWMEWKKSKRNNNCDAPNSIVKFLFCIISKAAYTIKQTECMISVW